MPRLFVALELPPPVRDGLLASMGGVAGARWQRDDQLHLTLRFIGDVDRHGAADVLAALATVNFAPFNLSLEGIGSFERRGRIDALWAGVTPRADVAALANRVDSALARIGIAPETRAFLPHVTLARLGREAGPISGFPARPIPNASFQVAGFALWESRLSSDGSDYSILERYPIFAGRR